MRPYPDAVRVEFVVQRAQALFEPGAFDRYFEVLEPDLEQLFVGQLGPREFMADVTAKFPTRHDVSRPGTDHRLNGVTAGSWRQLQIL